MSATIKNNNMTTKQFLRGIVKTEKGKNTFSVIASTAVIDRQGESIDQAGWDLENYKKNPVILWAHNYEDLPIGIAEKSEVNEQGLIIEGRFANEEDNPKAGQVRRLYEDEILRTVSVGFIPKEREGNRITKAELLEVSFVPVPANPEALAFAMTKGMKIEPALVELIEKCPLEVFCEPKEETEKPTEVENEETKPPMGEPDEITGGTQIQTLILSKKYFPTEEEAVKWITEHDFKTGGMEETEGSWRFRQFDPEYCDTTPKTIEITEGVNAVICVPKDGKTCGVRIFSTEEKSGRVLSQKNRTLISGSIQTMKTSIASLEKLLEATEPPEKGGDMKPAEVKTDAVVQRSESKSGSVEIPVETLKELLSHTREADKHNELSNAVIKRILKR